MSSDLEAGIEWRVGLKVSTFVNKNLNFLYIYCIYICICCQAIRAVYRLTVELWPIITSQLSSLSVPHTPGHVNSYVDYLCRGRDADIESELRLYCTFIECPCPVKPFVDIQKQTRWVWGLWDGRWALVIGLGVWDKPGVLLGHWGAGQHLGYIWIGQQGKVHCWLYLIQGAQCNQSSLLLLYEAFL